MFEAWHIIFNLIRSVLNFSIKEAKEEEKEVYKRQKFRNEFSSKRRSFPFTIVF